MLRSDAVVAAGGLLAAENRSEPRRTAPKGTELHARARHAGACTPAAGPVPVDAVTCGIVVGYDLPWPEQATFDMQGMSSQEWSAYMHDVLGLPGPPARVNDMVIRGLLDHYEKGLPPLPGAQEAVARMGVASRSHLRPPPTGW